MLSYWSISSTGSSFPTSLLLCHSLSLAAASSIALFQLTCIPNCNKAEGLCPATRRAAHPGLRQDSVLDLLGPKALEPQIPLSKPNPQTKNQKPAHPELVEGYERATSLSIQTPQNAPAFSGACSTGGLCLRLRRTGRHTPVTRHRGPRGDDKESLIYRICLL